MIRDAQSPVFSSGAVLSDCGRYRYSLWRQWSEAPPVLFLMLNPSTADAERDDPTIRRCIGFARDWGHGGVRVCNLFAWRATRPEDLPLNAAAVAETDHPNRNDVAIANVAHECPRIIAAWGAHPAAVQRGRAVLEFLGDRDVHALKLTVGGAPRHPLYIPAATDPILYHAKRPNT